MTRPIWVIGAGGLLGSHLVRALAEMPERFTPWPDAPRGLPWNDPPALERALADGAARLASTGGPWAIVWAAGAAVIGSPPAAIEADTHAFERFVAHVPGGPGALVALASSASGVHGRAGDLAITEASPCHPVSAYGKSRLAMERMLASWAVALPGSAAFTARISNLYGPGQNLSKRQGLISHVIRSALWNRPVNMYVSLDTIRDYIYAPDCAARLAACLARLAASPEPTHVTKLLAAEHTATLGQVLDIVSRVARRPARLLTHGDASAAEQLRRFRFRSTVWRDLDGCRLTDLQVGIHRTYEDLFRAYREGRLAPPA